MTASDLVRCYGRGVISRSEMLAGCINALGPDTLDATLAALAEVLAEHEFWAELEIADTCGMVRDVHGHEAPLGDDARAVLRDRRARQGAAEGMR